MVMTVPNFLTLLRILAVPIFAIALWYGEHAAACAIFLAAGLTDLLDGYVARRFNQGSSLGAILDPAADKLLMTTAFALMAWRTQGMAAPIPAWVAILAITRDVVISVVAALSAAAFEPDRFRPTFLGKLTTAVEVAALGAGLLINALGVQPWQGHVIPWLYRTVAFLVVASGIHYFVRMTRRDGAPA